MTITELEARHTVLIQQGADIEAATHNGDVALVIDGTAYPVGDAAELTRAAIYEVEMQLEQHGALDAPLGGTP